MATPATVVIKERNGAPAGTETTITNCNMVNVDDVNQTVSKTTAITAGQYSYEKWHRFNVTAFNDATDVGGLKVWASAGLTGSDVHKTNARETGWVDSSYAQPVGGTTASTLADQTMPTSEPTGPNVAIANSYSTTMTSTGETYSDYLIQQVAVNSGTTVGKSITMNYQYDEYA